MCVIHDWTSERTELWGLFTNSSWLIISTRLTWRGSSSWFRNCSSKRVLTLILHWTHESSSCFHRRVSGWGRLRALPQMMLQTACAQQSLTLSVHSGNLELSIGVNVLSEAARCFPGAGLVHAADYFIHILNTHIFRKHSTSDSRDPFFYRLFVSFHWAEPF